MPTKYKNNSGFSAKFKGCFFAQSLAHKLKGKCLEIGSYSYKNR